MAKPFSQRHGYVKVTDAIQLEGLNNETRKAIWNFLYLGLFNNTNLHEKSEQCARYLWIHYFNNPADDIPDYDRDFSY